MHVRPADADEVVLDPYDYDFHEEPYHSYRRLRDEAPLYYNHEMKFWALSRHRDVLTGFRNSSALSSRYGISLDPISRSPHAHKVMSFVALDDPEHSRLRALVSKGFSPRRIRELEPTITAIAVQHLEAALQSHTFDFVEAFAGKFPMDVISEIVGVPATDRDCIRVLGNNVVHRDDGMADVPKSAIQASGDLVAYYATLVAERRKRPRDDLTSALIAAEIDGDHLTDEEISAFLFLLVAAGNETTTKLLANALYWGSVHAEQLAKVHDDHALIPSWIEETLRFDTPIQILARSVSGPLTLYGTTIPHGDVLLLLPGSANRDGRVFKDADCYRIGRDIGANLATFGSGAHFCLGAHLARMEARVALVELLKRISAFEVDTAGALRVHSTNARGFARLPLTATLR
jgi:cytochrome P450